MTRLSSAKRAVGLAALDAFLPRVPTYAAQRGFVSREGPEVSRLSAYITRRLITEQEVVWKVLEHYPFHVAEKFIQEVVWRTYWKGWLERNPYVWASCVEHEQNCLDEQARAGWGDVYARACCGETQLSFFNEWVAELTETGYLHNHVRMWFASVWAFTLRIPWQLGAMFMFRNLLDGDPASNTLSWRWVVGLQTKGKRYLARSNNIANYSNGRWSPKDGELAVDAFEVEPDLVGPSRSLERSWNALPRGGFGVLTTGEDLSVERNSELMNGVKAVAVLRFRRALGQSSLVERFSEEAQSDALDRLGELGVGIGSSDEGITWARTKGLSQVVVVGPAVGPNEGRVLELATALGKHGVACSWYRRTWDTQLHCLADKGFFPFWERVRKRISRGDPLFQGE